MFWLRSGIGPTERMVEGPGIAYVLPIVLGVAMVVSAIVVAKGVAMITSVAVVAGVVVLTGCK